MRTAGQTVHAGVDVQLARGLAWVALRADGRLLDGGWVDCREDGVRTARALREVLRTAAGKQALVVGIDAPRQPLTTPREWYWDGRKAQWRPRRESEAGAGRHCEVVVSALGLGRPQYTRGAKESPAWMRLGFALFEELAKEATVHEVFPSASYSLLAKEGERLPVPVPVAACARGPKDILDAAMAAATVREYARGKGSAVGGGDGLGTIVLPKPVKGLAGNVPALHDWPG